MGWLILPVALAVATVLVWVSHTWSKLVTTQDIAIFAAMITFAATFTAVRAAQASRDAAEDSRRALFLHFRPGKVRIGFSTRDPSDPNAQMLYTPIPDPAPLWLSLTSWDDTEREYELVWTRDDNKAETRNVVLPAHGEGRPVLLDGIAAREDQSGPTPEIIAAIPRLILRCRDGQTGAMWRASKSFPTPAPLGSYALTFDLDEGQTQ
jgi:hypothetical protein